jgi:hypothetical protein
VKVFREAAREGLEEQAKKIKATSSKKFQNLLADKIKLPDIDRAKMDPIPIIAVIADIKDEEFYELVTNLPIYLMQRKFFKQRKCWYGGNKCK